MNTPENCKPWICLKEFLLSWSVLRLRMQILRQFLISWDILSHMLQASMPVSTSQDKCTHISPCVEILYMLLTDVREKQGICPPQARMWDLHVVSADKTWRHLDSAETQPAENHDAQHGHWVTSVSSTLSASWLSTGLRWGFKQKSILTRIRTSCMFGQLQSVEIGKAVILM